MVFARLLHEEREARECKTSLSYHIASYCIILFCYIILCYIILYYIILYYIILFYIVLYHNMASFFQDLNGSLNALAGMEARDQLVVRSCEVQGRGGLELLMSAWMACVRAPRGSCQISIYVYT